MFFLLTKFLHPINRKILLSSHFGFHLDNPRTREEVETVRAVIKKGWDLSDVSCNPEHRRFPLRKECPNKDIVTWENLIEQFCKKHFSRRETIKILAEVEGDPEKVIDFYVKHWVIIRYGNGEMQAELSRIKEQSRRFEREGKRGLLVLEDDHIFEKRNRQAISYAYLLSLLSGKDEYFGWSFLMTEHRDEVVERLPKAPVMSCITHQVIGLYGRGDDLSASEFNFLTFLHGAEPYYTLIDKGLKSGALSEDYLMYIGDVLSSAKPQDNIHSSLVRLVGIVEMLVTHQPDFNRFNVDESITKQFVLKAAVLAYMSDKSTSLEEIEKNLKEIYKQRSNIVHGNFSEVDKFLEKLKCEDRYFSDLISNAYKFARVCLVKYIEDPAFIQFLKKS